MQRRSTAKLVAVAALLGIAVTACSSSASAARPIGASVTSSDRIESVYAYAERVLPQSFDAPLPPPGQTLAIGEVEVCVPGGARTPQPIHAADFQLVLPGGRRVAATSGAIAPPLRDVTLRAGSCVHGFVNWFVAPDQHPSIVDVRTGVTWNPKCPKSTAASAPCQILVPQPAVG